MNVCHGATFSPAWHGLKRGLGKEDEHAAVDSSPMNPSVSIFTQLAWHL